MTDGDIQDFIGMYLSRECIGLLIRIKANPGICKSNCVPWLDWHYPVCSSTSSQWYLKRLWNLELIDNRSERGISHMFITDKGEKFLDKILEIMNTFDTHIQDWTWDKCMENARIKEEER